MKNGSVRSWKITREIETARASSVPIEAEFVVYFPFVEITIRTSNCQARSEYELLKEAETVISKLLEGK